MDLWNTKTYVSLAGKGIKRITVDTLARKVNYFLN